MLVTSVPGNMYCAVWLWMYDFTGVPSVWLPVKLPKASSPAAVLFSTVLAPVVGSMVQVVGMAFAPKVKLPVIAPLNAAPEKALILKNTCAKNGLSTN